MDIRYENRDKPIKVTNCLVRDLGTRLDLTLPPAFIALNEHGNFT